MLHMRLNEPGMGNTVGICKDEVKSRGCEDGLIQDLALAKTVVGLTHVFYGKRRAQQKRVDERLRFWPGPIVGYDDFVIGKGLARESGQNVLQFAHRIGISDQD